MRHEIDLDSFRATAKVLRIINPYAENYPESSLVDHMVRNAQSLTGGYLSTLGYVLSYFEFEGIQNPDGTQKTGIHASVATYTTQGYIDRQTNRRKA